MRTLVPFDAVDPKTRLAPVLDADERGTLARLMLADVLATVREAGHNPLVLSTAAIDEHPQVLDADLPSHATGPVSPVRVDDRALSTAVNAAIDDLGTPIAVVMADCPLATPATIERLVAPDADVVLAPGLGGGTNAFCTRTPAFRVDYHGASIRDHRERAAAAADEVAEVDSRRLATDVDRPDDLAEVLLHGTGATADWLADVGFEIAAEDGRVRTVREDE